jgi:hypothetical protein
MKLIIIIKLVTLANGHQSGRQEMKMKIITKMAVLRAA